MTAIRNAALAWLPRASGAGWRTLAAFAFIIALAAALRLHGLGEGHPGLAIYTSISANMARGDGGGWLYPSMLADGAILADKPPVFFWLQGASFALFGISDFAARLPSALAGIASVILLFIIIRRCHGVKPALISAAALAVMPLDVNYSRSTFIEPVAVLFMMLAAYFAVRAVQERREGFFHAAAFVLGVAFLTKLWQGLLPAPAICAMALACRWTSWARFVRVAAVSAAVFSATALWWAILVWLAPAYDSVMHAENVWDMIFGWNLTQRFGALEYGANHRRDILWFLTGPMSLFLGVSLLPSAALGAVSIAADMSARARTAVGRAFVRLRAAFPAMPDAAAWIAPRRSPFAQDADIDADAQAALSHRPSVRVGLLWTVWALAAVAAFGGTSVRLATYWTAAAPAFAALSGIGIASLAPRLRRRDGLAWALAGIAFAGIVYCAGVYGAVSDVAPHFRQAALICWALAAVVLIAIALMYFELRAFGGKLPAWTITAACAAAALASGAVVFHNITQPRDDTLGRIGFDMVDFPAPPPETLGERQAQLQGALITAIVRTDLDDLTAALDYVRRHGGGERRYLLAADTYNTAAMVAFLTGEPVLPLYSEYSMTPLMDADELRRVLEAGETRFILSSSHMQTMDWRLYGLIRSSATEVTSVSGLPQRGEMRLFRVRERRR